MTRKSVNVAASVRARLTQRARDRRENAQFIVTRYAIERLLYRLSLSPYRESFVLKGAMLFSLWAPTPYRATGDLRSRAAPPLGGIHRMARVASPPALER